MCAASIPRVGHHSAFGRAAGPGSLPSASRGLVLGDAKPLAAFGELGLTGELREAAHPDRRLAEAAKFGLDQVVSPGTGTRTLRQALSGLQRAKESLQMRVINAN